MVVERGEVSVIACRSSVARSSVCAHKKRVSYTLKADYCVGKWKEPSLGLGSDVGTGKLKYVDPEAHSPELSGPYVRHWSLVIFTVRLPQQTLNNNNVYCIVSNMLCNKTLLKI